MRIDVITLFPEIFASITDYGISARAMKRGLWNIHFWNPRDVTEDVHRTVDDRPFGGGPGMGQMVLVCGRYEGIDERFLETYVDHTVSLGDFVLSGAELAACALIDAVVRQLPGAIKELSASDESFSTGLLDAPHYTRPEVWRGPRCSSPAITPTSRAGRVKNL